jgi:hypothetical protein
VTYTNVPPPLPEKLQLDGLLLNGSSRRAIIDGVSFAAGEVKEVKLRHRTVQVRCRKIHSSDVLLEVDGQPKPVTLRISNGQSAP